MPQALTPPIISLAAISFGGDVLFGSSAKLGIELDGPVNDQITVAGELDLRTAGDNLVLDWLVDSEDLAIVGIQWGEQVPVGPAAMAPVGLVAASAAAAEPSALLLLAGGGLCLLAFSRRKHRYH